VPALGTMDGRLACQTDETTDAWEIYRLSPGDCDDCKVAGQLRGVAMAPPLEDEGPADITSLAKAALGLGQAAPARAIAPQGSAALRRGSGRGPAGS
jgi:hypothetical protein